ncbi:MAG: glycerol-3-phosphate 1-O-acyltransferase PlsY [Gemmatimonadota bacterium]
MSSYLPWLASMATIAAAYLLGSLPFAVIVSRLLGLADPRTYGSGNPGATNVLRSGSKIAAGLTLLGDAAKGAVAVWLARRYGVPLGVGDWGVATAGLAAFVGHLYPVFLRFRGGKGVATFLGVLLTLNPWVGLIACATWLLMAVFFRFSSLASLSAAIVAPLVQLMGWGFEPILPASLVMSALLIMRHQRNIAQLLAGKEKRIGERSPKVAQSRQR